MNDPDRLAEARRILRNFVRIGDPRLGLDPRTVEDALMFLDKFEGEAERLREVETDWSRVREELTNAKRAIANITQRLDLKLDELSKQDAEIARLRGLLERLATETLLARAVIHEIAWGQIVVITEHPQLRATLEAWGQEDKIDTPELQRLAAELRST